MDTPAIAEKLVPFKAIADLIGKPVYTFKEGRKVGVAKEVFFDETFYSFSGISLGREGIFSRNTLFTPVSGLKLIGEDIILIESESVIEPKNKEALEAYLPASYIEKKEIVDRGIKLAVAGDIAVSADSKILGLTFAKILVQGKFDEIDTLPREAIQEIGSKNDEFIYADLDKF